MTKPTDLCGMKLHQEQNGYWMGKEQLPENMMALAALSVMGNFTNGTKLNPMLHHLLILSRLPKLIQKPESSKVGFQSAMGRTTNTTVKLLTNRCSLKCNAGLEPSCTRSETERM